MTMKWLVILVALSGFAFRGVEPYDGEGFASGETPLRENVGDRFQLLSCRLEFGGAWGDYIGLRQGYGEAAVWATGILCQNVSFFVDAREFILGNRGNAASIGGGLRSVPNGQDSVWGMNLYYDFREAGLREEIKVNETFSEVFSTQSGKNFNRLGVGFEWFTPHFESCVNVYLPLGASTHSSRHVTIPYPTTGDFAEFQRKMYIRYGVDGEIGKAFCINSSLSAYAGIGAYYYDHKDLISIVGPQARFEMAWRDFIKFQLLYSYDDTFYSSFQGKFLFSIPLESLCKGFTCCQNGDPPCIQDRNVKRNYIPFVEECLSWAWSW